MTVPKNVLKAYFFFHIPVESINSFKNLVGKIYQCMILGAGLLRKKVKIPRKVMLKSKAIVSCKSKGAQGQKLG